MHLNPAGCGRPENAKLRVPPELRAQSMVKNSFRVSALILALLAGSGAGADDGENSHAEWIANTAALNRHALHFENGEFSGPGWDELVAEGRRAQFFLIGEEHGIAENPILAARLFAALAPSGYRRLAIEISPPMAAIIDRVVLDGGLEGLRALYAQPGGRPAFFGMTEEAEMLVAVRKAVPADEPAFWGADYEVAGDRTLLRELDAAPKPPAAEAAFATLSATANAGWDKHAETQDPQHIFTFAADPELVRAVKRAWPLRDDMSASILDALESTLEINTAWRDGHRYESNRLRAANLRDNFLDHWMAVKDDVDPPRVMAKFGANHLVRGRNMTNTFDLGALIPELAAQDRGTVFSVMVVPGRGSPTAVLDPTVWEYKSAPPKDNYQRGLGPLFDAALPDTFTLIDLRPIRAVVATKARSADPALVRVVFGFDMLLVMSGSTAAANFELD